MKHTNLYEEIEMHHGCSPLTVSLIAGIFILSFFTIDHIVGNFIDFMDTYVDAVKGDMNLDGQLNLQDLSILAERVRTQ